MPTMGKYCKAYLLKDLRKYPDWKENAQNARKEHQTVAGSDIEAPRKLTDDDIVYLQENHVVTDGIMMDENVIFDQVTPEWIAYGHDELGFDVPEMDMVKQATTA